MKESRFLIVFSALCLLLSGCMQGGFADFMNESSHVVSVHTVSGGHTDDFALQIGESHTVELYGVPMPGPSGWGANGSLSELTWQPSYLLCDHGGGGGNHYVFSDP
jgi:hypothetical protein